jgi:hypothetical protein
LRGHVVRDQRLAGVARVGHRRADPGQPGLAAEGVFSFRLRLPAEARNSLARLDGLDLTCRRRTGRPAAFCCPFHSGPDYDPTRHDEIIDLYVEARSFAEAHILPAPVLLLGDEVALDPDRFVVEGTASTCWPTGNPPR